MSTRIPSGWFPEEQDPAAYDPVRSARGAMKPSLPQRFYEQAGVAAAEDGFRLVLDGRPARTPGRRPLALAREAAAALLAAEWEAQRPAIDPARMPVTRIVNAALDHVAERQAEVAADIARYAGSDLLFYRAEEPRRLVERQQAVWDPVLAWAEARFGARFVLSAGIMHVEQPAVAVARIAAAVGECRDPAMLAALHVMTTLSGSVLLALAVAHRHLDAEAAFAAAELDADVQQEIWGSDEEALAARTRRAQEMNAAAALCLALGGLGDAKA